MKVISKEKKAKTGIQGLDDVLGGGFPAERFFLIEGSPGTGKTTLALQFLLEGAKNGEAGLYVTLSESKLELAGVARSHGWNLDDISIFELIAAEEHALPEGQYTFLHPSEVELGQTTKSLIEAVEKIKPARVIFDSLSELRLLARDALRYRRQVLGLKQFFAGRACTVLVLDDLTSNDADLQPQSIAHGVVTLATLVPEYGSDRRRLRVSKLRGVRFRGGYHDFVIQTGGVRVYPRLVASEHLPVFAKGVVSTANERLDKLLGGGLDRGSSALIMGPAGAGKSTLASTFAVEAARRGERAAIFIFDENIQTYLQRSERLGLGITKFVDNGLILIKQIDPTELAPGEFTHYVRSAAEDSKAKVIIIDSLNGFLHAMPEERFLILHMHEILTFLSQLGVISILLLAQHGVIGSRMDSGNIDLSYMADTVILLRYFEAEGRVRKAISILKKRTGTHEETIREFAMTESEGITIGEPLTRFHGVLTGVPVFMGEKTDLMEILHDQT